MTTMDITNIGLDIIKDIMSTEDGIHFGIHLYLTLDYDRKVVSGHIVNPKEPEPRIYNFEFKNSYL